MLWEKAGAVKTNSGTAVTPLGTNRPKLEFCHFMSPYSDPSGFVFGPHFSVWFRTRTSPHYS